MSEDEQARYRATYLNERGEIMGLAQALRSEGREEGRELGIPQGEAQILRRLLTRRFGPLPDWAEAKLKQASTDTLETWADRILTADSLEAFFYES